MTREGARRELYDPTSFACTMVRYKQADGVLGGVAVPMQKHFDLRKVLGKDGKSSAISGVYGFDQWKGLFLGEIALSISAQTLKNLLKSQSIQLKLQNHLELNLEFAMLSYSDFGRIESTRMFKKFPKAIQNLYVN